MFVYCVTDVTEVKIFIRIKDFCFYFYFLTLSNILKESNSFQMKIYHSHNMAIINRYELKAKKIYI